MSDYPLRFVAVEGGFWGSEKPLALREGAGLKTTGEAHLLILGLWEGAREHQPSGDLTRAEAIQSIEKCCAVNGLHGRRFKSEQVVNAMLKVEILKFRDKDDVNSSEFFSISGWFNHTGKGYLKRPKEAQKKRNQRAAHSGRGELSPGTGNSMSPGTAEKCPLTCHPTKSEVKDKEGIPTPPTRGWGEENKPPLNSPRQPESGRNADQIIHNQSRQNPNPDSEEKNPPGFIPMPAEPVKHRGKTETPVHQRKQLADPKPVPDEFVPVPQWMIDGAKRSREVKHEEVIRQNKASAQMARNRDAADKAIRNTTFTPIPTQPSDTTSRKSRSKSK